MTEEKTTGNGTAAEGAIAGGNPYALSYTLSRTWGVLPGATLVFKLRMYLSGELARNRESTIGLDPAERIQALTAFRIRVLSDILLEPPGGFPDFPETTEKGSTDLAERALEFFSRRDEKGSYIFALLVEDVVTDYWNRAIPSPTSPASGS